MADTSYLIPTAGGGGGSTETGWVDDGTVVRLNNSSDSVGIGITDPTKKLTVAGSISAQVLVYDSTSNSDDWYKAKTTVFDNSGSWGAAAAGGWTDDGTVVRLTTVTDNVGIGTTDPNEKLTVSGNISANGSLSATGTAPNYFVGNIGIGTTTPSVELDVVGGINTSSGLTNGYKIGDVEVLGWTGNILSIADDSTTTEIKLDTGGTTRMTIKSDGKVGIGIEEDTPGEVLTVAGTVSALDPAHGPNSDSIHWNSAHTTLYGNSAIWEENRLDLSEVATTSADWNTTRSTQVTGVGFWDDVVSTVKTSSGSWGGAAPGWTDDGAIVRLTTSTDLVNIGLVDGSEQLTLTQNISAGGGLSATGIAVGTIVPSMSSRDRGALGGITVTTGETGDNAPGLYFISDAILTSQGATSINGINFGGRIIEGGDSPHYDNFARIVGYKENTTVGESGGRLSFLLTNATGTEKEQIHLRHHSSTNSGFMTMNGDISARGGLSATGALNYFSGNVGIGTTSPISTLEIESGLTTVGAVLTLGTKEPSVVANDVLGRINFYAPLDTGTDSDEIAASIVAIAQDTFSDSVNSTALVFQTGKSEVATTKMVIDEDGKVGIGVTDPDTKLEVDGAIHISGEVSSPSAPSDADGGILYTKADGKPYWISNEVAETDLTEGTGGGGTARTDFEIMMISETFR